VQAPGGPRQTGCQGYVLHSRPSPLSQDPTYGQASAGLAAQSHSCMSRAARRWRPWGRSLPGQWVSHSPTARLPGFWCVHGAPGEGPSDGSNARRVGERVTRRLAIRAFDAAVPPRSLPQAPALGPHPSRRDDDQERILARASPWTPLPTARRSAACTHCRCVRPAKWQPPWLDDHAVTALHLQPAASPAEPRGVGAASTRADSPSQRQLEHSQDRSPTAHVRRAHEGHVLASALSVGVLSARRWDSVKNVTCTVIRSLYVSLKYP